MKWIVCINNDGYAASLEARKLYQALEDDRAAEMGFFRVVDESGEDYLYPQDMFMPMHITAPLEKRLLAAA